MKSQGLFANVLDRLPSCRGLRLGAATVLCVALFPGSILTVAPDQRIVQIQALSTAAEDPVEVIGLWPYGRCEASAIDPARNIALIGNGETLQVLDISTPYALSRIGEVRIAGSVQGIVLAGHSAYLVTRNFFVIVDLSDLRNPRQEAAVFISGGLLRSIVFRANFVYLASQVGLLIFDVSNPRQPVYQGRYSHDNIDVHDVALWGGYVLCLGRYWKFQERREMISCLEVVDISFPASPILVGTFDLGKDYTSGAIDASAAGHAYICQSNERHDAGRLMVIDIATDPVNPSEIGRYVKADKGFNGIELSGNYAYLLQAWPIRLGILDIVNPQSPVLVGECQTDGLGEMVSAGNLLGISHGGGGFSLYGVTNPASPYRLANYDTPDTIGDRGGGIAVRGDDVFMACNTDGLRTIDVSEPADPREAGICQDRSLGRGLAVSGKYAYAVGHGNQNLCIYDISHPRSPSLTATLDLPCPVPASDFYDYWGVAARGPYVYVSGTNWGANPQRVILWIIDVSDPFAPRRVGSLVCANAAQCVGNPALSGNHLYIGVHDVSQGYDDFRAGLRAIDVSDAGNPREVYVGMSDISGYGVNVVVRGRHAYLTGDMLRIFDISNPVYPRLLVSYRLSCEAIDFSGDYAYLNSDKLWVVDISDIYYPTGVYYRGEMGRGVAVSGNLAYVPGSLAVLRNNSAPAVSITSPSGESTLLGSAPIEVQASHSSGIDRVEFYVDESLEGTDTSEPFSYAWDTTGVEDGLHTIRVRATNTNGKSSDAEREVFTRLVYAPLGFAGKRVLNRSLLVVEHIDVLSWRAHPDNVNIVKYRLYRVEERQRNLLVELSADTFEYWHRRVVKDQLCTYALIAVNNAGRESDPVSVTVRFSLLSITSAEADTRRNPDRP